MNKFSSLVLVGLIVAFLQLSTVMITLKKKRNLREPVLLMLWGILIVSILMMNRLAGVWVFLRAM